MLGGQSDSQFRHGSIPLLLVGACSFVSPTGSSLISLIPNSAYKVQLWAQRWDRKCWMSLCPRETQPFFRHWKGCNIPCKPSQGQSSFFYFAVTSRKEHTQGHGKEEPSFNPLPLFSLPFSGIGLAINKAPCHAHSQAAHFCLLLSRGTINTVLAHDKESLICSKVFQD